MGISRPRTGCRDASEGFRQWEQPYRAFEDGVGNLASSCARVA